MTPPKPPPVLAAPERARKRRPWWLFLPHVAVATLLVALGVGWFVVRAKVIEALDAAPAALARAGVEAKLGDRTVDGFPFRIRVAYAGVRLARGGWTVEAPALVAQAYAYDPGHWVLVAPQGMTVTRPLGGPIVVTGQALRASVAGVAQRPWRVSLVGDGVRFATPVGARPFSLQSADRIEAYLKPASPDGSGDGAVLVSLTRAHATPEAPLATVLADAPFDAVAEGRLTHLAALEGADWNAAVRAWTAAGGGLTLGHVEAKGGTTEIWAVGGAVAVGRDGRIEGAVPLRLRQGVGAPAGPAPPAPTPADLARAQARREGESAEFNLVFEGGQVRLGPLTLGPSPKVE